MVKKETIKQISKEYGVEFNGNPKMTLVNWLKKKGMKSLATALKRVESNL